MAESHKQSGKPDAGVRFLAQMVITTVLWAGTFVVTKADWFTGATGVPARAALVAVGFGGFLPVVFLYAKSIRMQDEFSQRVHLVALAIAFAVIAVISYGVDLLHQAGFIAQPPSAGLWALMMAVWFVTMMITPRFYR
jgi:hypothetical protein